MKKRSHTVNVLWTGGWDSTYRVIQLVRQGKSVSPHYLIDNNRESTKIEIDTITNISNILNKKYGSLINDAKIIDSKTLTASQDIKKAHQEVLETGYLGYQYTLLASYCQEFGITGLELCIHKDDKAYDHINDFVQYNRDIGYILSENSPDHLTKLFKYFCFPILDITKLEMQEHARGWDADGIMEMTWFCHTPFMAKPCGTCYPCMYTIDEGLSRRFSKIALIRHWLKLEIRKFRRLSR